MLADSGYSVDIRIKGRRVVIEVDGPSHFVRRLNDPSLFMNGPTLFKDRLLRRMGWSVVHVPFFDWNKAQDKQAYLKGLLHSV